MNKMESEEWKFRRNYLTKEGDKSTYVCNRNKLCKAEVRLFYDNAISMLKQWSIDRSVPEGSFSNMFEIDEYYTFAYTWMKEQGVILRVVNTFNFIVCKKNYEDLINDYQNFLYGSSQRLCLFLFRDRVFLFH